MRPHPELRARVMLGPGTAVLSGAVVPSIGGAHSQPFSVEIGAGCLIGPLSALVLGCKARGAPGALYDRSHPSQEVDPQRNPATYSSPRTVTPPSGGLALQKPPGLPANPVCLNYVAVPSITGWSLPSPPWIVIRRGRLCSGFGIRSLKTPSAVTASSISRSSP